MKLKRINVDIMRFLVFALIIYLVTAGSIGLFAVITQFQLSFDDTNVDFKK